MSNDIIAKAVPKRLPYNSKYVFVLIKDLITKESEHSTQISEQLICDKEKLHKTMANSYLV